MNLRYHFWNRGEILNKMAMFNYFSSYTQIAYFPRPFEGTNPVAQWRRVGLNFLCRVEILNKITMFKYFYTKLKLRIFQDNSIMGPNQWVSQPIAWLYRLISQPKKMQNVLKRKNMYFGRFSFIWDFFVRFRPFLIAILLICLSKNN